MFCWHLLCKYLLILNSEAQFSSFHTTLKHLSICQETGGTGRSKGQWRMTGVFLLLSNNVSFLFFHISFYSLYLLYIQASQRYTQKHTTHKLTLCLYSITDRNLFLFIRPMPSTPLWQDVTCSELMGLSIAISFLVPNKFGNDQLKGHGTQEGRPALKVMRPPPKVCHG